MAGSLGPYELRGELGRGAMAVVWRGFDSKLEREVAIKEPVVAPGTADHAIADLSARFVREGKAAAQLNHPGIVTIHAADVFDGRPAIVMELIEGETLATILDRGPLPPTAAVAILDQLLDAVAYAHDRGVVHRDIKPDNVFVTPDGRVKLADFGIAHVGSSATLTQAGTVMGTPGYMAPEQVTGDPIDGRADIFAIGSIAYEMLSGHNPFGATDGIAPTTVMYRIVHEQPPAIPEGALAELPVALAPVIGTALAKDPADRFSDARAFRTALAGGPIVTGRTAGTAAPTVSTPAAWGSNAAAAATVVNQSGSTTNWTPYIILGGIAVVIVAGMFVFAGGPKVSGGDLSKDKSVEPTSVTPPPPPPEKTAIVPTPRNLTLISAVASTENMDGSDYYPALQAVDGATSTCWEEGVSGNGVGQWLEVSLGERSYVSAIRMIPGYKKNEDGWDRWWSNGRVRKARFTYDDGSSDTFSFTQGKNWQTFTLPAPKLTSSVKMTILSAYPPKNVAHKANDTSVSEIGVKGWTPAEAGE